MSPTIDLAVLRRRGPAWNHAVPMHSQALWAEHAVFMNSLAAEGLIVLGGPIGNGEDTLLVFGPPRAVLDRVAEVFSLPQGRQAAASS